jgi:hypothetical protein
MYIFYRFYLEKSSYATQSKQSPKGENWLNLATEESSANLLEQMLTLVLEQQSLRPFHSTLATRIERETGLMSHLNIERN